MKETSINGHSFHVVDHPVIEEVHSWTTDLDSEDVEGVMFGELDDILQQVESWRNSLTRVKPFYAVRCNDDPVVLSLLSVLGVGFSCVNRQEIKKVLDVGSVDAEDILFSNPCKISSHVRFAVQHGIDLFCFDNESELYKLKDICPKARLLLHIKEADVVDGDNQSFVTFGCPPDNVRRLLDVAQQLELNVVGIKSETVNCQNMDDVLSMASEVFGIAASYGFQFDVLDIGEGIPCGVHSATKIAAELNDALDAFFPRSSGVQIVAEPGKFFVLSAFSLAVRITACRSLSTKLDSGSSCVDQSAKDGDRPLFTYYVSDGVFGSFGFLLSENVDLVPTLIKPDQYLEQPLHSCRIWGPTMDDLDCLTDKCWLPQLSVGDWLLFHNMGVVSGHAAGQTKRHHSMKDSSWRRVKKLLRGQSSSVAAGHQWRLESDVSSRRVY